MIHWLMNLDMAGGGVPQGVGGGGGPAVKRRKWAPMVRPLRVNALAEPEPATARWTIYAPEAAGSATVLPEPSMVDGRAHDPYTSVCAYIEGISADMDAVEVRAAGIHNLHDEELALVAGMIGDLKRGTSRISIRAEDLDGDEELALIIAELLDKWIS